MELMTRHFGAIEIDAEKIVDFQKGVFGFENLKRYIILYDTSSKDSPFAWLQAIDDKDICLPLISPMVWYTDYEPDIDDALIESIGNLDPAELDIYSVVVIPNDIKDMTTNLQAPIVINNTSKKGMQVIVNNDEYEVKHNLYEQLEKLKKVGE